MAKKDQSDDIDALTGTEKRELGHHMLRLGVTTVEAYRAWCREHGFGPQLRKRPNQRRAEVALVEARDLEALKQSKRARRNPAELVDGILAGRVEREVLSPELRIVSQLVPSLGRQKLSMIPCIPCERPESCAKSMNRNSEGQQCVRQR